MEPTSPLLWRGRPKGAGEVTWRWLSALAVAVFLTLTTVAHAVQPDEILGDVNLEARARSISAGLRCLVCQNQSIDDSDAPVARDLRLLIREQLLQNRSDADVVDFVVSRYGDYVLLKPRFTPKTALLWLTPFLLLVGGGLYLWRRRKPHVITDALSASEKAEVERLLRD